MRLLVVNGPNLNMLGTREPEIYGSETLEDLERSIAHWAIGMSVEVACEQSNSEAALIDLIQQFDGDGIVINPGALTHTSRAIADAIRGVGIPVVEVHISNVRGREPWRAESVVSGACVNTIYGRGASGYRDAMRHLVNRAATEFETVRYGPHRDNVGDLRRGGGDLVVFAHGGLWRHEFTRDSTESLATDLTARGYDTWNIEYRRLGDGGGWPGSAHDALTALDFIPQLGLGQRRVVIVSHSAGSQLMMWAASRSTTPVNAHIAMGPLIDLRAAVDNGDAGAAECSTLLDHGAPAQVSPDGVATTIIHGDADQIVPVERTLAYAHLAHVQHKRTVCDHFSLLDPTKPEWDWTVDRIEAP